MYCAIGVEPTKEIDCTTGLVQQSVDRELVALQHGEDAVGEARLLPQLRRARARRTGSFSDGLRTTALPAAIAIGKNHIGTIAGKLNGEMMPTTPSGCLSE